MATQRVADGRDAPVSGGAVSAGTAGLVRLGVRPTVPEYLRAMWARREFAYTAPLGELRAQHMNTLFGGLWHVLNPLLLTGVYYLVFGIVLNARRGEGNYLALLLVGLLTFQFTAKTVNAGARTILSNLTLIQSVYFPRGVLPITAMLGESLSQIPAIATMILLVAATGVSVNAWWLLVIPIFLLQSMWNLGLVFLISRLTVHFRDVQQFLPYVIRMWMYLSGVLFTIDQVAGRLPDWGLTLFKLNPMFVFITLMRGALIDGSTDAQLWLYATAWSTAALIGGFLYFLAHESEYGRAY